MKGGSFWGKVGLGKAHKKAKKVARKLDKVRKAVRPFTKNYGKFVKFGADYIAPNVPVVGKAAQKAMQLEAKLLKAI